MPPFKKIAFLCYCAAETPENGFADLWMFFRPRQGNPHILSYIQNQISHNYILSK